MGRYWSAPTLRGERRNPGKLYLRVEVKCKNVGERRVPNRERAAKGRLFLCREEAQEMEIDYLALLGRLAPIVSALVGVISFLMGWIVSARKSRSQREKEITDKQNAICEGVLALIRTQIVDDYEKYVIHGAPLTVERRHELDRAHDAYVALGGNGTIGHLYNEIKKVPTHIAEGKR